MSGLAYRGLALSLQFIVLLINERSPSQINEMKREANGLRRDMKNCEPTLPLYSYFLSKVCAESVLTNLSNQ